MERFLYVGDRYEPFINTSEGSRYIFLAMEVHANGTVVLKPPAPWGLHDWPATADETSPERRPRRRLLTDDSGAGSLAADAQLPLLLLSLLVGAHTCNAGFIPHANEFCMGDSGPKSCTCGTDGATYNKCKAQPGFTVHGTHYAYMADVSLDACRAKCEATGCRCFDFSPTPARKGENCRVCAPDAVRELTVAIHAPRWRLLSACLSAVVRIPTARLSL